MRRHRHPLAAAVLPSFPRSRPLARLAAVLALALAAPALGACGREGPGGSAVAPPLPPVALSLATPVVNLAPGREVRTTVTITRAAGFAGEVRLAVTGVPLGAAARFDPAVVPAGAGSSTLTVITSVGAAPGTYPLIVRASAEGVEEQTVSLALVVTQPGVEEGISAVYRFCGDASARPIWFGALDAAGSWVRVRGVGGRFVFELPASRTGIAWVTGSEAAGYSITVLHGTGSSLRGGESICDGGTGGGTTKTLTGTVAGLSATTQADVALGGGRAWQLTPEQPAFTLRGLPSVPGGGPAMDLIATRTPRGGGVPDRLILRRGVSLPNNAAVPVLDFAAAEAFAPEMRTLTIVGLAGERLAGATERFFTATHADFAVELRPSGATTVPFVAIPFERQISGDLYNVMVTAVDDPLAPTSTRRASVTFRDGSDRPIVLAPPLAAPQVVAVAGAFARLQVRLPLQMEYDQVAQATYAQPGARRSAFVFHGIPPAGAAWDLSIPDLAGAPGFDPAWGPRPGVPIAWRVSASRSAPAIGLLTSTQFGERTGTTTVAR